MPIQIIERPMALPSSGIESTPTCHCCGVHLRFFSDRLYGRALQECTCGVQPVQPYQARPVHIPASIITEEAVMPFARVQAMCAACGRTYTARAVDGAVTCSAKCRRRAGSST